MKAPNSLITLSIALTAILATTGFSPVPGAPASVSDRSELLSSGTGSDPVEADRTDAAAGPGQGDDFGIHGADPDEEAQILDGMDHFTAAGLPLPDLRIYVHDSPEGCRGHHGLYSRGGDKHRIDLCLIDDDVIRHELAHAWEHHHVDEKTRRAFMERVGVDAWNDHDTVHPHRGIEIAAYLVSWGLDPKPVQRMHANRLAEDLERFELLTGRPTPRIAHWDAEAAPARPSARPAVSTSSAAPVPS